MRIGAMADVGWMLVWLVLTGAAAAILWLALALARIVGVGVWPRRIATAFCGLIGLCVAFGLSFGVSWPTGWLIGLPVGLVIPAFGLFLICARALQHRSPIFDDAMGLIVGQHSRLVTQAVRSVELDDDFSYKVGASQSGNGKGVSLRSVARVFAGFFAGLKLRSATLIFAGITAMVLAAMRLASVGSWRHGLINALMAGLLGAVVFLYAAPSINSGWAVRREQILQTPELRTSLESSLVAGWLMRFLLRRWLRDQERSNISG